MRRDFAIVLWLLVCAILGAELASLGEALEYRRGLAFSEPWRLFTAHYVHLSFLHASLNAVALILLGHLFADRLRPRDMCAMLIVAPMLLSLAFWFVLPELQWYRGLSGVLHAIYFAGCVAWVAQTTGRARWLPIAALVGGAAKVLVEQPWDASFPMHEVLRVAVVPQAHLVGAIVGTAAGLALRRRRQQAEPEQS
jgi:rhomboid family GlyGly-CTERM serine protease